MNDDFFTVTTNWQFIQCNGEDITDGTFSISLNEDEKVFLFKTNSLPAQSVTGTSSIRQKGEFSKFTLDVGDKLAARTGNDSTTVGVIPA